jgi:hypothetical protein
VSPYCDEMFQVRAMMYAGINFQQLQVNSAEIIKYTILASAFGGTNQRMSFITGLRYVLFQLYPFFSIQ